MRRIGNPPILRATLAALSCLLILSSCSGPSLDKGSHMVVSVKEQKMLLVKNGKPVKTYPVSTSKFGLGSKRGSMRTPLGRHRVARKIGGGAPKGAVFKSRKRTGEILKPNAPGRDPIVSRILWLQGMESGNKNSYGRYIYIHGTPEERTLGSKSSYGCVRMASRDVIDLYKRVPVGANVHILRGELPELEDPRQVAANARSGKPRAGSRQASAEEKARARARNEELTRVLDKPSPRG